ncbi:MAG: response regulator, partial [Campylobacterota bacterium]
MYLANLELLVVDDEMQIKELVSQNLSKLCKKVHSASNGQEAIKIYQKEPIDLVISDIRMPVMHGIDLLKEIKKIDYEQVVVLFSGSNDTDFLIKAINAGCDKFFTKPLDFMQLKQELELLAKKIVAQKQNDQYKKVLKQKWQIDHKNHRALINEFEQYLELIDATNCIRKYDNEGNIVYINTKLQQKLGHDTDMKEAFAARTKLNDYLNTQGKFKNIIR